MMPLDPFLTDEEVLQRIGVMFGACLGELVRQFDSQEQLDDFLVGFRTGRVSLILRFDGMTRIDGVAD